MDSEVKMKEALKFKNNKGLMVIIIVLLAGTCVFLYLNNRRLVKELNDQRAKQDAECSARMAQERVKIKKDFEEKYRADIVSFQAMSQRLEIEKNKTRELEEKIRTAAPAPAAAPKAKEKGKAGKK
ncbi:MAG: hypothetical protein NTU54_04455 [Candidatus Omnitrophica bacterium]|nr:hypothetical protein [Candidatus Omnitrophota bacterium]